MYLVQLESGLHGVAVYDSLLRRWHSAYTEVASSFFCRGMEMLHVQGKKNKSVDVNVCYVTQF